MRTLSHFPSLGELCGGFLHLLYPDLCVACQQDLPVRHSCFCLRCQWKNIPFDLSNPSDNACTARLWGRLPVQWGSAAYHFTRKSPIQKAMHHLKYHNKPDIGVMIGRELGKKLLANPACAPVDAIVPVPLHPKRERLRGYNQSTVFAQGLSDAMNVPLLSQSLLRCTHTATQTNKKRMERFQNVGDVFTVQHEHLLKGKHLLLVDDVLTTGATLEMCGLSLLQVPDTRLSIATIAIADR
jgi:ComF family protein